VGLEVAVVVLHQPYRAVLAILLLQAHLKETMVGME